MRVKGIRKCDMFGVPISLKLRGESHFATTCGGSISIALKCFLLSFFCMQLVSLVTYNDPQISSFTILDSRHSMTSPVTMDEYGFELYFFFCDE